MTICVGCYQVPCVCAGALAARITALETMSRQPVARDRGDEAREALTQIQRLLEAEVGSFVLKAAVQTILDAH